MGEEYREVFGVGEEYGEAYRESQKLGEVYAILSAMERYFMLNQKIVALC